MNLNLFGGSESYTKSLLPWRERQDQGDFFLTADL
jgi:hypothetical protein